MFNPQVTHGVSAVTAEGSVAWTEPGLGGSGRITSGIGWQLAVAQSPLSLHLREICTIQFIEEAGYHVCHLCRLFSMEFKVAFCACLHTVTTLCI